MIVGFDVEHDRDDDLASGILRTLVDHYPGHSWFVLIRGGVIQIKNTEWSPSWGMALHYSKVTNDAAAMKKEVIRAAGEFLERANVARAGRAEDQSIERVEGIADKWLNRSAKVMDEAYKRHGKGLEQA